MEKKPFKFKDQPITTSSCTKFKSTISLPLHAPIKMKHIEFNQEFQIQIQEKINYGTFSEVFKAINLTMGIPVPKVMAIKRYRIPEKLNNPKNFKDHNKIQVDDLKQKAVTERDLLIKLKNCPQICKIFGFCEQETPPYIYSIALELAECSLKEEWEQSKRCFPPSKVAQILNEMTGVLAFLQGMGIIHSDIKPSNIFCFKESGEIHYKLGDFNSSINLKEEALKSFQNLTEEIKIPIRGTPLYMSPEYIQILTTIDKKFLLKCLKQSEQVVNFNLENEDTTMEHETAFTVQGHKIQIDLYGKKKEFFGDSGSCKNDMFSLGLMTMRLLGIKINGANFNSDFLEKAIKQFKINVEKEEGFGYLSVVIDGMLHENFSKRYDFINLREDLVSKHQQDIENPHNLMTSQLQKSAIETFVGAGAFSSIWKASTLSEMNSKLFESVGYKCFCVTVEFYDFILKHKQKKENAYEKFKDDVINKYPDMFELGEFHQKDILEGLEPKVATNTFQNLLFIYTMETNFYEYLNKALAINKFTDYENYLHALLNARVECGYKYPEVPAKTKIYRGISLVEKSENGNFKEHINQYIRGMVLHWPCITSCTKTLEKCETFVMKMEIGVIFEIEIDANNRTNKVDLEAISYFSEEMEILLFPFFKFEVTDKKTIKFAGRIYTLICVKEIEGLVLNYKMIWFDPYVNVEENMFYQEMIKNNNPKVELILFTEMKAAVEFINKMEHPAFVMSCGSQGEAFLGFIHENDKVVKMFIFTSEEKRQFHENWTKNYKFHNKLVGVFDNINDIMEYLPDENLIY